MERFAARERSPLFRDHFKLALFASNMRGGLAITNAPDRHEPTWESNVRLVKMLDDNGYEAFINVAQWKGFGGDGYWDACLEPCMLSAGLAALTKHTVLVTTMQATSTTPYFMAKQIATLDNISGGRAALNVVAGWRPEESALFDAPWLEHEDRYHHLTEWVEIAKAVWTNDEPIDYAGKWFHTKGAIGLPKPVQAPYPPLINAAQSSRGRQFASKHADIMFVTSDDLETGAAQVREVRELAHGHGREVQVLNSVTIVSAPTEKEAQEDWDYHVVKHGDRVAGKNAMDLLFGNTQIWSQDSDIWAGMDRFLGGLGTMPIIGTPEQVVEVLRQMAAAGYDGTSLSFFDFEKGLRQFTDDILPLMEQAGLRKPFQSSV